MNYTVDFGERSHEVSIRRHNGGWLVAIDGGEAVHYTGEQVGQAEWILQEGGRARAVGVHVENGYADLQIDGHPIHAKVVDPRRAALDLAGGASEGAIETSMPGVVVRVLLEPGAEVKKGDVVLVVEAMKMENEFKAPCDGTLEVVHVQPGQAVEAHTLLASVTP